jgi:hypothetical protein
MPHEAWSEPGWYECPHIDYEFADGAMTERRCTMPAEAETDGVLDSTHGPVPMARVRCLAQHAFLMPLLDLKVSA